MADPPFAPWGTGVGELTDDRPWEVRQFVDVYALLGAKSRSEIDDIDDLYVFELAGLLGVGKPKPTEDGDVIDDDLRDLDPGRARAVMRMRAAEAGVAPPEPTGPPAGIDELMRLGVIPSPA